MDPPFETPGKPDDDPSPPVAILHYTATPVVGGVETVIDEHVRLLAASGRRVRLIVGRGGEGRAIPACRMGTDPRDRFRTSGESQAIPGAAAGPDPGVLRRLHRSSANRTPASLAERRRPHDPQRADHALQPAAGGCPSPHAGSWNAASDFALDFYDASWIDPYYQPQLHPGLPWSLLRRYRSDLTYVVLTRQRQVEIAKMLRCPQNRLNIVPNGIRLRYWWNLSSEGERLLGQLGLLETDLVVLQPTRITRLKNLQATLYIAHALKELGVRFRLIVTGPPDPHDPDGLALFRELASLRSELGLQAEVIFLCEVDSPAQPTRSVPHAVVRDLYQVCDVVLLPSTSEGFGIPLLEAGIVGRGGVLRRYPAVSRDRPGPDLPLSPRRPSCTRRQTHPALGQPQSGLPTPPPRAPELLMAEHLPHPSPSPAAGAHRFPLTCTSRSCRQASPLRTAL